MHLPMTVNFPRLVKLLAEHLYPERGVFVREMIQNAHDSLCRRRAVEPGHRARIDVLTGARTLTFADNGTGLTPDEVRRYLTVFGQSGTDEVRQAMARDGRRGLEEMIGQFGIGLLSGFLVADRIVVETRSVKGTSACRWTYDGGSVSTLEEPIAWEGGAGTRVILMMSRAADAALPVRDLVVRYADFLPVAIHVDGSPEPVNAIDAPWHRAHSVEEARMRDYGRFLGRRFSDVPLELVPVDVASPYRVQGVLYISDRRIPDAASGGAVDVYCKRMLVAAGDTGVLPPWASFVRGVIDSPDITITASRCAVQRGTRETEGIRAILSRALLEHLEALAGRDPALFGRILRWHHYHVRRMALEHDEFFDAIAHLVPFECNRGADGLMNLETYLADGRATVHYFTEFGAAAQYNELCGARDLVVLNASYAHDEAFLKKFAARRPGVALRRLSDPLLFEPVADASKYGALCRELAAAVESLAGLNAGNPLIERLAAAVPADDLAGVLVAVFSNATLLSSQLHGERTLRTMHRLTNRLIEQVLSQREALRSRGDAA